MDGMMLLNEVYVLYFMFFVIIMMVYLDLDSVVNVY